MRALRQNCHAHPACDKPQDASGVKRFLDNARNKSASVAQRHQIGVKVLPIPRWPMHEILVCKLVQPDAAAFGERVMFINDAYETVPLYQALVVAGTPDRSGDEADVEISLLELAELVGRNVMMRLQDDTRLHALKFFHEVWQCAGDRKIGVADAERADLSAMNLARIVDRALNCIEYGAAALKECLSGWGEDNAAVRALEQGDGQLVFEIANGAAERRLGDAKPHRCTAEMKLLRHRSEISYMP